MDKNEPKSGQKKFIGPITTPILFWIFKSIGSAILGWVTLIFLDRFRKKPKTDVDSEVEKEVS
jgi:hypothetical protein